MARPEDVCLYKYTCVCHLSLPCTANVKKGCIQRVLNMGEEFLQHAYKSKCEFQMEVNGTITMDIETGVRKMIEMILQHLKIKSPVFAVANLIPTGSFYEGTKIGAPDEFDFMLTLAKLSGADKISLQPGCSDWYPYIKLQPGVEFPQKYKINNFYEEERKNKDFLGNPRFVATDFWKEIANINASVNENIPLTYGTMSFVPCNGKKLELQLRPAKSPFDDINMKEIDVEKRENERRGPFFGNTDNIFRVSTATLGENDHTPVPAKTFKPAGNTGYSERTSASITIDGNIEDRSVKNVVSTVVVSVCSLPDGEGGHNINSCGYLHNHDNGTHYQCVGDRING
uniref:Uncharacterized protein n=1 Tax=Magallana gigas TaxID=29159 RepID=K1R1R0_MAGGI